jgi:general stress protein 26
VTDLAQRFAQVIADVEHATVATVSQSGEPWNTPVYFARDGNFFYWTSRTDAQHSINIRSNGRVFLVIYDSKRPDSSGCGVYVQAQATELQEEADIDAALRRI